MSGFDRGTPSLRRLAISNKLKTEEKAEQPIKVSYEDFLVAEHHKSAWVAKVSLAMRADFDSFLQFVSSAVDRHTAVENNSNESLIDELEESGDDENLPEPDEEHDGKQLDSNEHVRFQKKILRILDDYERELERINESKQEVTISDMCKLVLIGQTVLFFCCKALPPRLQNARTKESHFLEFSQARDCIQGLLHSWFLSNSGRLIDRVELAFPTQKYRTSEIEFFLVTVGLLSAALKTTSNVLFDRLLIAAAHWKSRAFSARIDLERLSSLAERVVENLGLANIVSPGSWKQVWNRASRVGRFVDDAHQEMLRFGDGQKWSSFNNANAGNAARLNDIL